MDDFSAKLRSLRSKNRIGIKVLAKDLGISYTYISHLERGKAKPSDDLIRKLASYFGVEEEDLLLSAGRFPPDVENLLYQHPKEVVLLLRESFPQYGKSPHRS